MLGIGLVGIGQVACVGIDCPVNYDSCLHECGLFPPQLRLSMLSCLHASRSGTYRGGQLWGIAIPGRLLSFLCATPSDAPKRFYPVHVAPVRSLGLAKASEQIC